MYLSEESFRDNTVTNCIATDGQSLSPDTNKEWFADVLTWPEATRHQSEAGRKRGYLYIVYQI
jgi:muramidase (phage lysozyme)